MDGAARTQIRYLRYMKSICRPNVLVRTMVRAPLIDSFSYEKKKRVESVSQPDRRAHIIFCIQFFLLQSKFMVPIIVWKIQKTDM